MGKLGLKLVFLMVILIEASIVMSQGDIKSVKIGNQVWMAENLNVDRYRNGDPINTGLTDQQWKVTTQGAFAIYDNIQANDLVYGKLYNWYAVVDPRGLCPSGWHVPSDDEWTILTDYLGGWKVAGGKLKLGQYGYFLSSTKVDDTYVRGRTPSFNGVALDATLFFKNDGFSVRCIKD